MSRKLAVIKDVQFGVGDYGKVALWFSAFTEPGMAALQVLTVEQGVALIEAHGVRHVDELNGKTVWVDDDGNMSRYVETAKI